MGPSAGWCIPKGGIGLGLDMLFDTNSILRVSVSVSVSVRVSVRVSIRGGK